MQLFFSQLDYAITSAELCADMVWIAVGILQHRQHNAATFVVHEENDGMATTKMCWELLKIG